jgi:hypothetical protein
MSKNPYRKEKELNRKQKQEEEAFKKLRVDMGDYDDPGLGDFFIPIMRRKQGE